MVRDNGAAEAAKARKHRRRRRSVSTPERDILALLERDARGEDDDDGRRAKRRSRRSMHTSSPTATSALILPEDLRARDLASEPSALTRNAAPATTARGAVDASRASRSTTSEVHTEDLKHNAAMFVDALGVDIEEPSDDAPGCEPYRKMLALHSRALATVSGPKGDVDADDTDDAHALVTSTNHIMDGVCALFVNVAAKRKATLAKLLTRMGGVAAEVDDEQGEVVTHVIASDDNIVLAKAMNDLPDAVIKVNLEWITACFKQSSRLSESDYAPRAHVAALPEIPHIDDMSQSVSTTNNALAPVEQKSSQAKRASALMLKGAHGEAIWTSDFVDNEKLEKRREFFVCQPNAYTEKKLVMECNTKVADILAELGEIYKSALRDEYRGKQYNQAANALRALNFEVTSTDQCDSIPMLSKKTSKIRKYVGEILSFGKLKALDEMKQRPDVKACLELTGVHGIGPVTAHKLFLKGYTSVADLRRAPKGTLSEPQSIGLKYVEEFKERIPREEVSVLATAVREAANTFMDDEVHCYCVGSFRRGRSSSGDIDVLVECRDESRMTDLLMHILNDLRPGGKSPRSGILTDDLLVGDVTYMGVARLQRPLDDSDTKPPVHRRMDIKIYHSAQLPTALLYFPGSMRFNRSMRLWAKLKGFNLQDKGLYADREQAEMSRISVTSEEDVFTALGLDYVSPERRDV